MLYQFYDIAPAGMVPPPPQPEQAELLPFRSSVKYDSMHSADSILQQILSLIWAMLKELVSMKMINMQLQPLFMSKKARDLHAPQ